MTPRYRVELLDTKTNKKVVMYVNNFRKEVSHRFVPIYPVPGQGPQMVPAGVEKLTLELLNPELNKKKKKKNGKSKSKPKKRSRK